MNVVFPRGKIGNSVSERPSPQIYTHTHKLSSPAPQSLFVAISLSECLPCSDIWTPMT